MDFSKGLRNDNLYFRAAVYHYSFIDCVADAAADG